MRIRTIVALVLVALLCAPGCSKDEKKEDDKGGIAPKAAVPQAAVPKAEEKKEHIDEAIVDVPALVEQIGVEPGAFAIEEGIGSEGVVSLRNGAVARRRAGEKEFQDIDEDGAKLYTGDQIRTITDSSAVLTLADETVIELAEDTTIAIGDRDAVADPASSGVVMAGVARFTVSERGEGEGPFLVYTPAGIIGSLGTTFGVAVAATGDVRVGVETGEVEVAGGAALDAPVAVTARSKISVSGDGRVGKVAEFSTDDWGEWRDQTEAGASASAVVEKHVDALGRLEAEIDSGYDEVKFLTKAVAKAEATAIEAEEAKDGAAYDLAAPELGATIEASYLASMRLQFLTYAMLSRAYISNELYLRYPEVVKPVFVPAAPRIYGAILYHKKYHHVVHAHVRPWRTKYYYHHPRGRAHAVALGYEVPKFYKKRKLKKLAAGAARDKLKVKVYLEPKVAKFNKKKKVWVGVPGIGWAAKIKVKPFKARGKAGWYIKVKTPKAKTWSEKIKAKKDKAVFESKEPTKRGRGKVRITVKRPGKKDRKHGGKSKYGYGRYGSEKDEGKGKYGGKGKAKGKGRKGQRKGQLK